MQTCRWMKEVERGFDGETPQTAEMEAHVRACPACARYVAELESVRQGVSAHITNTPVISDAQFPHFMEGIRAGIETPVRRPMRFWAAISLTAAALLVALATFSIFYGGPEKVRATEIESVSTDLEGATVDWYDTKEGVTTVWVNVAKDDIE